MPYPEVGDGDLEEAGDGRDFGQPALGGGGFFGIRRVVRSRTDGEPAVAGGEAGPGVVARARPRAGVVGRRGVRPESGAERTRAGREVDGEDGFAATGGQDAGHAVGEGARARSGGE
ncbi:hypothetical protein XI38_03710 [Microbacterium aurantiacum]|uniref:Uncharacterized protein n=1 Tax=Microbacterium aurantiacum TaxID=162393 RepID=A0A0M9VLX8_9MICO|nr:hypothetical protein XI38_03710 [Microbacterium chocolatum]